MPSIHFFLASHSNLFFKASFPVTVHLFCGHPTDSFLLEHPPTNSNIPYSLHMTESPYNLHQSFIHTLSLSYAHRLYSSFTHTHALSLSYFLIHACTHNHALSLSLSLSYSHKHTHSSLLNKHEADDFFSRVKKINFLGQTT